MKKAVPTPRRPHPIKYLYVRQEWERLIDNFDRTIRRKNKAYREHVVRINHSAVGLISSDKRLPLSRLNFLGPTTAVIISSRRTLIS